MSTRRFVVAIAASSLVGLCVSCEGTGAGLSSVKGKLICNGQPAVGAVLSFHLQSESAASPKAAPKLIPSAVVQSDGSFTVETHPLGSGAAPGKYAVLVQWPEENEPAQARSAQQPKVTTIKGKTVDMKRHDKLDSITPDRLKGRYSDASKPLLVAEVKPGPNDLGTLELELELKN